MPKDEILSNIEFFIPPFQDKGIEEFINECYRKLELTPVSFENYNPFLFFIVVYNNFLIPVGFLQGSCIYERIEIEQFFVVEEHRGYDFGKILMENLINYAVKMNCNTVSLEVNVKNMIAIRLYKKFDFEIVALRKNYYNNGEDAYLMVKKVLVNSYEE